MAYTLPPNATPEMRQAMMMKMNEDTQNASFLANALQQEANQQMLLDKALLSKTEQFVKRTEKTFDLTNNIKF